MNASFLPQLLQSVCLAVLVSSMATTDALQFVQIKQAPNLYWAIAAMPSPLIDMRHAFSYERELPFEQIKILREVDERARSPDYWRDFVDRFVPQVEGLDLVGILNSRSASPEVDRAKIASLIAANYAAASQFLIQDCNLPAAQVEAYPTTQVVFLAMVKFHRIAADRCFKWTDVPLWQAMQQAEYQQLDQWLQSESSRMGFVAAPTMLLLPAFPAVNAAQYRAEQSLVLLQTIESLRMYAAEHDGALPPSLDQLSVPPPLDPFTGKPVEYELSGEQAVLSGTPSGNFHSRIIVEIAH